MNLAATQAQQPVVPTAGAHVATPQRGRDLRIDAAKAIAILLVVFCHAKGVPHGMTLFAYSFHVPLFFLVSGWLASGYASRATGLSQTVSKQARSLLLPYVVFYLLGYAYWLLTRNIGEKLHAGAVIHGGSRSRAMFTGIGPDLYVQPPLWFLPVMLVTVVGYVLLRRWLSPVVIAVASLAVAWFWMYWFPAQGVRIFRAGCAAGVAVLLCTWRLADPPLAAPAEVVGWERACDGGAGDCGCLAG